MEKVNINSIKPRTHSQRTSPKGVQALVKSIRQIGLIHPIIIDSEHNLIAGGNRLEAFKILAEEDSAYQEIPVIYKHNIAEEEAKLIELDENIRREDLTWKERTKATVDLVELLRSIHPEYNLRACSDYLGIDLTTLSLSIYIQKELDDGNTRIAEATSFKQASNIYQRQQARKLDNETNELIAVLDSAIDPEKALDELDNVTEDEEEDVDLDTEPQPSYTKSIITLDDSDPDATSEIINADFTKWVQSYRGRKFNFLHCDFPYGIDHGNSPLGGATVHGSYEDSEDVYWNLLKALATHRDKILYPSAHIIFWFSMKYYTQTIEFFAEHMPEMQVDHQPLIWHKTDNRGIIRNPKHTPRNITETALLITRGSREILQPVANCYGAPTQKSQAKHLSEKPISVLRHFFRLCVDEFTEILDPTCGSGSAIRAADSMNARRGLGIELDSTYAKDAQKQLESHRALNNFHKKGE